MGSNSSSGQVEDDKKDEPEGQRRRSKKLTWQNSIGRRKSLENVDALTNVPGCDARQMARVALGVLRRTVLKEPLDPSVRGNLQFVQAALEGVLRAVGEEGLEKDAEVDH